MSWSRQEPISLEYLLNLKIILTRLINLCPVLINLLEDFDIKFMVAVTNLESFANNLIKL